MGRGATRVHWDLVRVVTVPAGQSRAFVILTGHPASLNVAARRHWTAGASGNATWRKNAFTVLKLALPRLYIDGAPTRVVVTMTRIRKGGRGLDSDSLPGSFKAVRDGVADVLWDGCPVHPPRYSKPDARGWKKKTSGCGHDHDDDPRIEWRYANASGARKEISIEVEWSWQKRE